MGNLLTIDYSQRPQANALDAIFSSGARVAVLRVFLLDPLRDYYQRQLESATGLPIRAVQRELERLTAIGLLYRRVEGNRTYYQVDMQFLLFPELRGMILKSVGPVDALRGILALNEGVHLAFLSEDGERALVVARPGKTPEVAWPGPPSVWLMPAEAFQEALASRRADVDALLRRGCDLLGRRDEVIWRHIEAAGYDVKKGVGVP